MKARQYRQRTRLHNLHSPAFPFGKLHRFLNLLHSQSYHHVYLHVEGSHTMQKVNILNLADELLVLIFDAVQSRHDLFSLMRVCRRLSSIADPLLYTSVLLRDIQDSVAFVLSLSNHSEKALQIRSLALDFAAHEDYEPISIIALLASMPNIQELSINSSDEENDAFDEVFNRALAPALSTNLLWSLRSCMLAI
jgi:hypothetical protein